MTGKPKAIALIAALLATGLVPGGRAQTSSGKPKLNIAILTFPQPEIIDYAGPIEVVAEFSQSLLPHETCRVGQKSGKPLAIPVGSLSSLQLCEPLSFGETTGRATIANAAAMPWVFAIGLPGWPPSPSYRTVITTGVFSPSTQRELVNANQPGPRIDQLAWVGSKVRYSVLRDNDKTVLREIDAEGTAPHDLAILTGRGAALSPDRHRLAYAAGKIWPTTLYKITVSDLKGKRARILSDVRFNTLDPAWSPDRHHAAFVQVDESRQDKYGWPTPKERTGVN